MRIDIIHMRDPDSSCDHEVYVDGKEVDESVDVHFWSFDPGAGYERDELEQTKQEDIDAAPDFLKARIEEIWDQMEPTYERWGL